MKPPLISIGCVANLYSRQMTFLEAGDTERGHTHAFNHLTLVASGSLQVTIEGHVTVFKAPHMIYISKDKKHELIALEPNTVAFCIHALRGGDGVDDIIDPATVPAGANISMSAKPLVAYQS